MLVAKKILGSFTVKSLDPLTLRCATVLYWKISILVYARRCVLFVQKIESVMSAISRARFSNLTLTLHVNEMNFKLLFGTTGS